MQKNTSWIYWTAYYIAMWSPALLLAAMIAAYFKVRAKGGTYG